ncbi:MAG: single-stranded DNA-binding protein [Anaerolineae bacterium]|nr:single-stranded DNA-binding protein [Anaerolineae bacterium]
MYHKVTIIGNLGRDPEMRYTSDGTPVTSFSIATSRKWNNPDGSQGEETIWFRITAWRKLAEVCNEYLSKGKQVFVEGRLAPDRDTGGPRVWTRRDGTPGASYELTATTIKFLGGRSEVGGSFDSSIASEPPAPYEEDDIPF